jgi:hypothetical protein
MVTVGENAGADPSMTADAALNPPFDTATNSMSTASGLALLEVIDRDGHVYSVYMVQSWPLHVGRSLNNHVVLSDPHIAPRHFSIGPGRHGLTLTVAETQNGVLLTRSPRFYEGSPPQHLHRGESTPLTHYGKAHCSTAITAGRTQLRLRMANETLTPELVLLGKKSLFQRAAPIMLGLLMVLCSLLLSTYLNTDTAGLTHAIGTTLVKALLSGSVWCSVWALLSKIFTRQAHFSWHLQVLLWAVIALLLLNGLLTTLAFALSWSALTSFAYLGFIAIVATGLYFHLVAIEPARKRLLKWISVGFAAGGIAVSMSFNWQRSDMLGDELYMSHLLPPSMRLVRPVELDGFINGLTSLKTTLDEKVQEPGRNDEADQFEED